MAATEFQTAPAWVRWGSRGVRLLPRGRYVLMNWLCRRPSDVFDSPLSVAGGGVRFVCDLGDGIAREACFMGYYEPQETALVRHLLRPGMTFADVGANWGYFTLLGASIVGPAGRVVACEPHPSLYRSLEQNVALNNFTWAVPLRVAVADAEGETNLAGFEHGSTNRGVSRLSGEAVPRAPNYRVRTASLSSILDAQGVGRVDLVKMDIEGAEAAALSVMDGELKRARYRSILLELHPVALREQGVDAKSLVEKLLGFGYRAWRLDHSQAAFRRAAYSLPASPAEFLEPYDGRAPLDAWPHLLFLASDVEPSW